METMTILSILQSDEDSSAEVRLYLDTLDIVQPFIAAWIPRTAVVRNVLLEYTRHCGTVLDRVDVTTRNKEESAFLIYLENLKSRLKNITDYLNMLTI